MLIEVLMEVTIPRSSRRAGLLALSGLLLALVSGCIARVLPIPPPSASVSFLTCDAATCGPEGLRVQIAGLARAGSMVVAENMTRSLPDGSRYFAATFAGTAQAGDGDAGITELPYRMELAPVPNPSGAPVACRHGDRLEVYQLVDRGDGTLSRSSMVLLTVP